MNIIIINYIFCDQILRGGDIIFFFCTKIYHTVSSHQQCNACFSYVFHRDLINSFIYFPSLSIANRSEILLFLVFVWHKASTTMAKVLVLFSRLPVRMYISICVYINILCSCIYCNSRISRVK